MEKRLRIAFVILLLWTYFSVAGPVGGPLDVYVIRDTLQDTADFNAVIDEAKAKLTDEEGELHNFQYLPHNIKDPNDQTPASLVPYLEEATDVGYPALVVGKDGKVLRSLHLQDEGPNPTTAEDIIDFVE